MEVWLDNFKDTKYCPKCGSTLTQRVAFDQIKYNEQTGERLIRYEKQCPQFEEYKYTTVEAMKEYLRTPSHTNIHYYGPVSNLTSS